MGRRMAAEDIYMNETFPKTTVSPFASKKMVYVVLLLAVVLVLTISLIILAILYSQKERNLQELEGLMEPLRCSLHLLNVSYGPRNKVGRDLQELLPTGWKFNDRNLYFFSQEKKTWQKAQDDCVSYGANLTSVTSSKEMDYLSTMTGSRVFWIGLYDKNKSAAKVNNRAWTWVDGTQYIENTRFWTEGQPYNPDGASHCVQMNFENKNTWHDDQCHKLFYGICKLPCP